MIFIIVFKMEKRRNLRIKARPADTIAGARLHKQKTEEPKSNKTAVVVKRTSRRVIAKSLSLPAEMVTKLKLYPKINDLPSLLKRNGLSPDTKVFIAGPSYYHIQNELLKQGWIENPDVYSNLFTFKFAITKFMGNFDLLKEHQITNHYENTGILTTKTGLIGTLKKFPSMFSNDPNRIAPIAFDLTDESEFSAFFSYFKFNKALSELKKFEASSVNHLESILQQNLLKKTIRIENYNENEIPSHISTALSGRDTCKSQSLIIERELLRLEYACDMVKEYINPWEDGISVKSKKIDADNIWKIVSFGDYIEIKPRRKKGKRSNKRTSRQMKRLKSSKKPKSAMKKIPEQKISTIEHLQSKFEALKLLTTDLLILALSKYSETNIYGNCNIWIVKPVNLSRGRGIRLFDNLTDIMNYKNTQEARLLVQKYIECPLLIESVKFDIRQWVLVLGMNPITIWVYDECYFRLSSETFDLSNIDDQFRHLTNNSIQKYQDKIDAETLIWSEEQFDQAMLKQMGVQDFTNQRLKSGMNDIIVKTIRAAEENLGERKNVAEIYGFDFMVDCNFKPWLIEINSSPAFDNSSVT